MSDYTSLVILTTFIAVGTTETKRYVTGQGPNLQPVLGGFFLGMILFILGMLSTNVASKFCYLIIASTLLVNGAATFTALSTGTHAAAPARTQTRTTTRAPFTPIIPPKKVAS